MKRSVLGQRAVFVAAVVMWGNVAPAESLSAAPAAPAVQVVVLDPKTCVSEQDVRSALHQAGVVLAPPGGTADAGAIRVTLEGTPAHLSVVMQGQSHDGTTPLTAATCQTATDVVMAFLISTLAPVATTPIEAPQLDAAVLDRAVRDDLARHGIQLALVGATLSLSRDRAGNWFASVQAKDVLSATRSVPLGNFDDLSPERIDAATDKIAIAIREVTVVERPAPPPPPQTALHNALDAAGASANATALGVAEVAEGALVFTSLVVGRAPHAHFSFTTAPNAFRSASASTAVLGGTASFFVDEDYRRTVVNVSALAAVGEFATGVSLAPQQDVPAYSTAAIAAGTYSTAAFLGLNAILRRPPFSRLRAARRELSHRRATPAEVREIEQELAATDPVVPSIVTYSPLIVGGAVSTLPAFADGFSNANRNLVAYAGGAFLLLGLGGAFLPSNYSWYQRELRQVGVSGLMVGTASAAPFGISISGRF